jgi:enoyl-CoA hydratase
MSRRVRSLAKTREIPLGLANDMGHQFDEAIDQPDRQRPCQHAARGPITLEQATFETADHKEATMSFKEKRKPRFCKN